MSQLKVEYREMQLGIRAPRVALLVDMRWEPVAFTSIIQALSQAWGGATSALIPTDGESISPAFWPLLDLHDPDAVLVFGNAFTRVRV